MSEMFVYIHANQEIHRSSQFDKYLLEHYHLNDWEQL